MDADEIDQRNDDQVAQHGARHHDCAGSITDDVADAEQFGGHVAGKGRGFVDGGDRDGNCLFDKVEGERSELVDESDAEADEDGCSSGAALFPGDEHLCGGNAFGIEQGTRLPRSAVHLDDKGPPQRDHCQDAENAA